MVCKLHEVFSISKKTFFKNYFQTCSRGLYFCSTYIVVWTLISDRRDPYKFCFYCSATHMTSQVLQPKTVNKWYRGRHTVISVHSPKLILRPNLSF